MKKISVKYITDAISSQELSDLKELLKKKKNKQLFDKYIKDHYDVNVLLNKPDVNIAYKKLWKEIEKQKQPRQNVLTIFSKYVAAAVIVFMLSLSFYFIQNQKEINEVNLLEHKGKPGIDKAILTFEDGSSVILEKGQHYKTEKVTSNGEQIVYKNKNNSAVLYNYLTVPRGGEFEIKLADGTQVWLNSESKLKYPVSFNQGEVRQVELMYGEAYFDVSSSKNHDGATFKVVSKFQEVEVLGTEFNIKAYKDELNVYTTLVEGKVVVQNDVFKEKLKVNYQSILNEQKDGFKIKRVNVYNETSWRKGIFSFKDKTLKEITKALSRWYDIDLIINNQNLEEVKFNGVLSKEMNLEEILALLKRNINLNYKIHDKKIILE